MIKVSCSVTVRRILAKRGHVEYLSCIPYAGTGNTLRAPEAKTGGTQLKMRTVGLGAWRRFPIKILMIVAALVISFPTLVQGEQKRPKMKMHKDAKPMKEEILKVIPIGSNIAHAKQVMQEQGFNCHMRERSDFAEREKDKDEEPVIHRTIDYLYCYKELPSWVFCERRWQIAIVHKGGLVSDVLVSSALLCEGRVTDRSIEEQIKRELPLGSTLSEVLEFLDGKHTSHSDDLVIAKYSSDYPGEEKIRLILASIRGVKVIMGTQFGIYMTFRFDGDNRLIDYRVRLVGYA